MNKLIENIIRSKLLSAGISINGKNPWDIQIHDKRVYPRVFFKGSLGLGESYMEGWWDCQSLDSFFYKILSLKELQPSVPRFFKFILSLGYRQSIKNAQLVAKKHYDLDTNIYTYMLGKTMSYTCGYWKNAKSLDQAQNQKLDIICKKLHLKKGMSILDVGCGFGSFAYFAAKHYGVSVVGINISKEQITYAKKLCTGLPVTIEHKDYRNISGLFDRVVAIGIGEHIGHKNFKAFVEILHRHTKDNGLCLIHTIGQDHQHIGNDPWIEKYIFPHGMIPTDKVILNSISGTFILEDWHNFGADYDKTLMAWHKNFENHGLK